MAKARRNSKIPSETPVGRENLHPVQSLQKIFNENGRRAARRQKEVGFKTEYVRITDLFLGFNQLAEGGYIGLQPHNLGERHIKYLVRRWEDEGKMASTILGRLSSFNTLFGWLGKSSMVRKAEYYLLDPSRAKRTYVAKKDKSWNGAVNQIDIEAKIKEIETYCWRSALMLELQDAFGLRRKESLMFRPHVADQGAFLELTDRGSGTKGGKPRVVPIETQHQREVLDKAKRLITNPNGRIGGDGVRNLKQAYDRFSYVMKKFGVTKKDLGATPHGLRHQYANDKYERETGEASPVRGGEATDRDADIIARAKTSLALGHIRTDITNSYYGSSNSTSQKGKS